MSLFEFLDIWDRTSRDNAFWTLVVIQLFNVRKISCVSECWNLPVQVSQPKMDPGEVMADHANVALEPLHIDRIESDNRSVQKHIGCCQTVSSEILAVSQILLDFFKAENSSLIAPL